MTSYLIILYYVYNKSFVLYKNVALRIFYYTCTNNERIYMPV